MSNFQFDPDARYRMPVLFGPTAGPRQGPKGERFDGSNAKFSLTAVRFRSEADQLERLLPDGFRLAGDPVVTIEHTILHDLAWLAGRSYSMLGVKIPVIFDGAREQVSGPLLIVLWENRAEPIISGREELGFNKLYCELPEPQMTGADRICRASWDGFEFFRLRLSDMSPSEPPKAAPSDGTLHYAYMPPMGRDTSHEARTRVMLSPTPATPSKIDEFWSGRAEFEFSEASFEQMPTMFQIVNVLAGLPVAENLGGFFMRARGKGDLSDQREVVQRDTP